MGVNTVSMYVLTSCCVAVVALPVRWATWWANYFVGAIQGRTLIAIYPEHVKDEAWANLRQLMLLISSRSEWDSLFQFIDELKLWAEQELQCHDQDFVRTMALAESLVEFRSNKSDQKEKGKGKGGGDDKSHCLDDKKLSKSDNKYKAGKRNRAWNLDSRCYCVGLSNDTAVELATISGFQWGTLPVRYLEIPLISSKLKHHDCQSLINRITARVKSWSAQSLSYAGRLQLISLVSVAQFWCMHYILPNKVTQRIHQICSNFLWKVQLDSRRDAKIKWLDLCLPKSEGGLGLKDLASWNNACIWRNLRLPLTTEGSLWVAWAGKYLICNWCFWTIKVPCSCSLNWRRILKLRDNAKEFISYKVGSESSLSL